MQHGLRKRSARCTAHALHVCLQAPSEQPGSTPRQSESTATRYSEETGSYDAISKHRSD